MKTLLVTFTFAIIFLSSCKKDEPTPNAIAPDGTLIAKVAGKDWKSTTSAAAVVNNQVTITGESSTKSYLAISLGGFSVKAFSISGIVGTSIPENFVSFTPENGSLSNPLYVSSNLEMASIGEVNITEIDKNLKTVSGTFSSKVRRLVPSDQVIEITSGSFTKIPYTENTLGVIPGNTGSAKINGLTFTPAQVAGIVALSKINLNLTNSNGDVISLVVPSNISLGSFPFGTFGSTYFATYTSGISSYESTSGQIVITKHDKTSKRIEGTFAFNGELFPAGGGSLVVTEGKFGISY